MSEPFLVEVWGEPASYLEKEGNAFRFHALTRPFFTLEGAQFPKPGHARLAAARLRPAAALAATGLPLAATGLPLAGQAMTGAVAQEACR